MLMRFGVEKNETALSSVCRILRCGPLGTVSHSPIYGQFVRY